MSLARHASPAFIAREKWLFRLWPELLTTAIGREVEDATVVVR